MHSLMTVPNIRNVHWANENWMCDKPHTSLHSESSQPAATTGRFPISTRAIEELIVAGDSVVLGVTFRGTDTGG
jgi:hypothetical protein